MTKYDNIIQSAAEKLLEDERLRASLSDDEASLLVNWAIGWLEERVSTAPDSAAAKQIAQAELARLRPSMQEINTQLRKGTPPSFDTFSPSASEGGTDSPRQAFIRDRIRRLSEEWKPS
jgi:hypothetical protein